MTSDKPSRGGHPSETREVAAPFADLIDRESSVLSEDDRSSLEYYYASINIAEGLPVDSAPRRWCEAVQNVGRVAHMLGRLPEPGDPGATPQILSWIHHQSSGPLNSYQRARLSALPGGLLWLRPDEASS